MHVLHAELPYITQLTINDHIAGSACRRLSNQPKQLAPWIIPAGAHARQLGRRWRLYLQLLKHLLVIHPLSAQSSHVVVQKLRCEHIYLTAPPIQLASAHDDRRLSPWWCVGVLLIATYLVPWLLYASHMVWLHIAVGRGHLGHLTPAVPLRTWWLVGAWVIAIAFVGVVLANFHYLLEVLPAKLSWHPRHPHEQVTVCE